MIGPEVWLDGSAIFAAKANEHIAVEVVDGRPPVVTGLVRTVASVREFLPSTECRLMAPHLR